MKDSYGKKIYDGDMIEYFHCDYAHGEEYYEEYPSYEECTNEFFKSVIRRAFKKGYTCGHYDETDGIIFCVHAYKPLYGIVKFNPNYGTYEPLVNYKNLYKNNSFIYVINENKNDGAYYKVIKQSDKKFLINF